MSVVEQKPLSLPQLRSSKLLSRLKLGPWYDQRRAVFERKLNLSIVMEEIYLERKGAEPR